MTDDTLIKHERELGAIGARIGSLETGHATTRADFKEALSDVRSDLKDGLANMRGDLKDGIAAIRDEMVRQSGHMRGEVRELNEMLEQRVMSLKSQSDLMRTAMTERVDDLERELEKQREAEKTRTDRLIETLTAEREASETAAKQAQKFNRGIILAIGAALVGAQQLLEHVLPVLLGSLSP